jgi:S-formylglutathione hydrolase FrmB
MKYIRIIISLVVGCSLLGAAGTVITDSFHSDALDATRYMKVYLPDGYDTSTEYYPVIYFLHGGNSNHNSYSNIYYHIDTLIDYGHIEPVIMVKPDASVGPYYGSCYTNSALYGDFEDYIVYDLIDYIETAYRAIPSRDSRTIMGHSMGGSGALKLAFNHPDIYRAVVDHSGLVDYSAMLQIYIPLILAENGGSAPYTYNPNAGVFTGVAFTLCGAFSPDTTDPPLYVDFILDSQGNIDSTIYDLWRLHDTPFLAHQVQPDTPVIYLDCGMSDEYHCYQLHIALVDTLDLLGLPYQWHAYSGNHSNQLNVRFPIAIAFLDSVMCTGVEEGSQVEPVLNDHIGATIFRGPLVLPADRNCRVFDISGREVRPTTLRPGVYFIEIAGSVTQKIIKVR